MTTRSTAARLALALALLAPSIGIAGALSEAATDTQQEEPGSEKGEQKDRNKGKKRVTATLVEPAREAEEKAEERAEERAEEAAGEAAEAAVEAEARAESAAETVTEEAAEASDAVEDRARAAVRAPAPAPRADTERARDVGISERVEVTEVLLDVVVTSRKGEPVTGLGADDFVVTEDGSEQKVTSVTYYGSESELRASGEGDTARSDRYFILFFHDQAQFESALRPSQFEAGNAARKWVAEDLEPNDQVAVVGYDSRLRIYADFTRDKAALEQAITDASRGKKEPDLEGMVRGFEEGSPSLLVNLPQGKRDMGRESRRIQSALGLLGRAAEGIVGRKNLMLISAGFGEVDRIGAVLPDPRYYPPMIEDLNAGNVAVYAVDLLGNRGGPSNARVTNSLSALADDTGGTYYPTFVNFRTPFEQVESDNRGYYLLSYSTEYPRGTGGYREVKVKVPGEGYRVRAREGYRFGELVRAED